jgi:hypothetical protein
MHTKNAKNSPTKRICVKANIFKEIKKIKYRDFMPEKDVNEFTGPNPYMMARKIKHPRERMTQYMTLAGKLYTNEKLHRLKMVDSPNCMECNQTETAEHLFEKCPRAQSAWSILQDLIGENVTCEEIRNGTTNQIKINLISLVKHHLYCKRNEPSIPEVLRTRLDTMYHDFEIIQRKKNKERDKSR